MGPTGKAKWRSAQTVKRGILFHLGSFREGVLIILGPVRYKFYHSSVIIV